MNIRKALVLGVIAVLTISAFGLTGCGSTGGSTGGTGTDTAASTLSGSLTVAGSDTMVNMAQAWAEAFMAKNPDVEISVKGGGSGTGIAALINGTIDVADASREMKAEELAKLPTAVKTSVARDGIAIIVNPANGVADISLENLGKVYRGEITNWKDLGGADTPIAIISRDSSSGTYEYFKEAVVGKDKEFAPSAKLLASNQAIVDEVKSNPNAIGYVGVGYESSDIKVIAVDGVASSVATVLDGTYKLSRDLYMYTAKAPTELAKTYIDWILSADGQAIVKDQGFVPVQ